MNAFYEQDLAYIHHHGFGGFARRCSPELLKILRRAGIRSGTIIDLGCGTGIWARSAANAGFAVNGVDVSPAMIELARKVAPRSKFDCGSLHSTKLRPCEAVTAIGEAFNYISGRMLPLPVLFRRISKALSPSGILIFDVIVAEGPPINSGSWAVGKDWAILVKTSEAPKRRKLLREITTFRKVGYGYRRQHETHHVELFRRIEIERALGRAGFTFRVVRAYGKAPLLPRRYGFICRKTASRKS